MLATTTITHGVNYKCYNLSFSEKKKISRYGVGVCLASTFLWVRKVIINIGTDRLVGANILKNSCFLKNSNISISSKKFLSKCLHFLERRVFITKKQYLFNFFCNLYDVPLRRCETHSQCVSLTPPRAPLKLSLLHSIVFHIGLKQKWSRVHTNLTRFFYW